MYSPLQLGWKYLKYYCQASNGKGHGIHSPFVFDFVTHVLNDKRHYPEYDKVENLRKNLLANGQEVIVDDMGAGSSEGKKNSRRTVKEIARRALKPQKFGQLLYRIAGYYASGKVLELGTSLGITTAYLALAKKTQSVITMEGASEIAALAQQNFQTIELDNIRLVLGNFDHTLANVIAETDVFDMAFVDGNHRYEPTVRYYHQLLPSLHENSILIFDDIYWSREMEQAWSEIKQQPEVTLSIDLFFIGLVFFRKENKKKQHFTIRF